MANRYVWYKYNKNTSYTETSTEVCNSANSTHNAFSTKGIASGSKVLQHGNISQYWMYAKASTFTSSDKVTIYLANDYTFNNGTFTLTSPASIKLDWSTLTATNSGLPLALTNTSSVYIMVDMASGSSMIQYYNKNIANHTGAVLRIGAGGPTANVRYYAASMRWLDEDDDAWTFNIVNELTSTTSYSKGTLIGNVSATTSTKYPSNTYSGSYWYVYRGYDCIDPTKVEYSTSSPKGGESITINVTPRTNTYGGTIYYQYQYSIDNGSTWNNSGSKTTGITKNITIPDDATQFQVRVIASDNYGFTSTTYITGTNLTVTSPGPEAYTNNGSIKKVKVYAGYGGTVRECDMYICKNGVITKV